MKKADRIRRLLYENKTYREICSEVGCAQSTVSYHARKLGQDRSNKKCVDWDAVQKYYNEGHTRPECCERFGISLSTLWSHFIKGDIVLRLERESATPLSEILIKNSQYSRSHLKKRLLKQGILVNICSECGLQDMWNGKPIVMHLDHINGVRDDNRIHNLRMLCPNCHSQIKTYSGRNSVSGE